jgi:hypothetical protein
MRKQGIRNSEAEVNVRRVGNKQAKLLLIAICILFLITEKVVPMDAVQNGFEGKSYFRCECRNTVAEKMFSNADHRWSRGGLQQHWRC